MFDLSNYIFFLAIIAIIYVAIVNVIQSNVGGKNRLKNLQVEMREVQLKMMESSKKGNEKEANDVMPQYWKLTSELFGLQLQMTAIVLVIFVCLAAVFPHIEPGTNDDLSLSLYDDGLMSHCDSIANDFVFSNCLTLPQNGERGAWTVDGLLLSSTNETLAKNATAIYFEGGKPEDVWLQASTQAGILDSLMGKRQYLVHIRTDSDNRTAKAGETVAIAVEATTLFSSSSLQSFNDDIANYNLKNQQQIKLTSSQLTEFAREMSLPGGANITAADGRKYNVKMTGEGRIEIPTRNLPEGARLEAKANSGTFFYYDAPITIPLINIRRIIGSYGVFIFIVFVTSMAFALGRALYAKMAKK
ncbi:MAG: hypothetical protein NT051_02085 [Candidatus Micrarchaeota archaeon]|nr:hypothetical protein [Candidatus Micrarchaeota archaeon]